MLTDNILSEKKNPPLFERGIFYLLVFFLLVVVNARSQPAIEVVDGRQSFGRVSQGDPVRLAFKVTNKGKQPLIFMRAEVSCECTAAELPGQPLAPGDTTLIHVRFDTRSAYGLQDRTVLIYSNDPSAPAKLRFRGNVRRR